MKLADALLRTSACLRELNESFAVVGGLAASARGEVRFTRDIDIVVHVVDDTAAEHCIFELAQRGYRVVATVEQDATGRLATARLSAANGVICDLIFATSGIEAEIVGSAEALELFPAHWAPTASVEALLAMKTLSATAARPRDLGDIQAIVRANPEFDEQVLLALLDAIENRGYARNQDLKSKWRQLRGSLKV